MKPKKKNKLFAFLFSFIPGCAEMYMGFMKLGISLMAMFIITLFIAFALGMESLLCISCMIWFYAFFHAINIRAADDEDFRRIEDDYIWRDFSENHQIKFASKTKRNCIAGILIAVGIILLWHELIPSIDLFIPNGYRNDFYWVTSRIPEIIFSLLIIFIGIRLIRGKKREIFEADDSERICFSDTLIEAETVEASDAEKAASQESCVYEVSEESDSAETGICPESESTENDGAVLNADELDEIEKYEVSDENADECIDNNEEAEHGEK